jgi:GxxExxY protein
MNEKKFVPNLLCADITGPVIEIFFQVYHKLGHGFLEKIYRNAMEIEIRKRGLEVKKNEKIEVRYDGEVIGEYYADLVVNRAVILELKASAALIDQHEAQLLNYLRATRYEVGILMNFGPKPRYKRLVFENRYKSYAEGH